MSKFNLLGIVSWLGSGILFLFQSITTLMQPDNAYNWEKLSINDLVSAKQLEWVNAIPFDVIQDAVDTIIHAQLIFVLLGLGLFFFILGIFFSKG